jgi:hypothetical protein
LDVIQWPLPEGVVDQAATWLAILMDWCIANKLNIAVGLTGEKSRNPAGEQCGSRVSWQNVRRSGS